MSDGDPVRLAHLSCIHCGAAEFDADLVSATVDRINRSRPDLVLVAGNLTEHGYEWEYEEARGYLDRIEAPMMVVPGSDDSRNVGFVHYQHHFGARHKAHRLELSDSRRRAIDTEGVTVVALDSSEPDLADGRIGREWYPWLREQLAVSTDIKVVLLHHHVVAIPGAGREAAVIEDAGDVLALLSELAVDIILTGSRHVPFFWGLNGMLVCNSGTAGSRRVRGTVPPSWNEIEIDGDRIRIHLHYEDGTRQLAAVRSRAKRLIARAHFTVTDDFFASNHLPVG
jgi:Icc protein